MFLKRLKIAAVVFLALGARALGAAGDQEPRPEKVRDAAQRLHFVLRAVGPDRNTIAVMVPGTKLELKDLRVAKDARVLLNGKAARLADLQKGAGKPITIALGADGARKSRSSGPFMRSWSACATGWWPRGSRWR